jgi:dihydropteroate synthase
LSAKHNIRVLRILNKEDAVYELRKIGVDHGGVNIMAGKMQHFNIKIKGLDVKQANIIKQEMLSLGADAAVHKKVVANQIDQTDAIIMATRKQLEKAVSKLKQQPFGLKEIAEELHDVFNIGSFRIKPIICGNKKFDFNENVYIMGILNVTPDSFSDGGHFLKEKDAILHAEKMVEEGADIIDIGGESTRPGSEPVPSKEEIKKVVPIIKAVKKNLDTVVSIDTYKADVAKAAINAGADIINDISAMRFDPEMKEVALNADVPVILMHIKGKPKDMQVSPSYDCVITEIMDYFRQVIDEAVSYGIKEDKIIIDPGIGFGKSLQHNITIIKRLSEFKSLKKPLLMGLSLKSFIGKIIDKDVDERLYGTIAANAVSVLNGANILRVHDVGETVQAAKMAEALI